MQEPETASLTASFEALLSEYDGEIAATATVIAVGIVRKSPHQLGFAAQPCLWVVERFVTWINRNRRLAKDFGAMTASSRTFLRLPPSRSSSAGAPGPYNYCNRLLPNHLCLSRRR